MANTAHSVASRINTALPFGAGGDSGSFRVDVSGDVFIRSFR
jgi:hypothetical protein